MAATDASLRLGSRGVPFDEMVGTDGTVRAHWREVAGLFAEQRDLALSAFQGFFNEIMPHGHAWRFVDLARRIERGIYLAGLTSGILHEEPEPRLGKYELLLKTIAALVTYRQKHVSLRAVSVLDPVLRRKQSAVAVGERRSGCGSLSTPATIPEPKERH